MLQVFKNVSLSPVDCGGRVLAVGEVAELHPGAHGVREALATGELLAVNDEPEPEATEPQEDEPEVAEAKPEAKTTSKRPARSGADKTATEES